MTQPRDNLARLRAALEAGRPVPEDVREWLLFGLRSWEGREHRNLEGALGLTASGLDHPGTARARMNRNGSLLLAAEYIGWPPPVDVNDQARRLAHAIDRFERRKWPRWQRLDEPPAGASMIDRALFRAKRHAEQAGRPMLPATPKQLAAILRGK